MELCSRVKKEQLEWDARVCEKREEDSSTQK